MIYGDIDLSDFSSQGKGYFLHNWSMWINSLLYIGTKFPIKRTK